jgi:diguanylate cyclase (GGDEF)-like protein/PAS domain S-box-containing protein
MVILADPATMPSRYTKPMNRSESPNRVNNHLQALLEDRERVLDSLMSNLEGMVYCCLCDEFRTMVFVSQGCPGLTGYKPDDILDNHAISFENIIHEEDRVRVREYINVAVGSRERFELEYRILHADGKVRWVLERGIPLFNEHGEVEALEGLIQNITRYKQSEEAAIRAEERYRSIFENAIEGIYQTSPSGQYLNFNPALARIYGYESPEDLAHGILDIQKQLYVDPEKRQEFIRLMHENEVVQNFEAQIYRKNGDIIWITENAREVHDEAGNILFYEGTVEDITERVQMEEQVRQLAYYDVLTQLPNRRLLNDRLNQAMAASKRNKCYGAVIFLDLDRFKTLNDTLGHLYGDLLLVEVANRLKLSVREIDTVARLGGDEFVVLIENISADEEETTQNIAHVAGKIRAVLAEPYLLKECEHHSTPSIGIYVFCEHDESVDEIIKRADMAMYRAKEAGRNQIRFYDEQV